MICFLGSPKYRWAAEIEKDSDRNPIIKGGIEYLLHPSLAIRLGASTNPSLISFGIGYRLSSNFKIDVASSYHQNLGFTPGLSIQYAFDK